MKTTLKNFLVKNYLKPLPFILFTMLLSILSLSNGSNLLASNANTSANKIQNAKSDFAQAPAIPFQVAQDAPVYPTIIWDKTIGGSGGEGLGNAIPTDDGGYLLAGSSASDASGDKSEDNKSEISYQGDYWIVKIDADGNKIWDKTIGGNRGDGLRNIIPAPGGGYLLAGSSNSDASGDKREKNRSKYDSQADYWVVRVDDNGNKLWDKTVGGNDQDVLSSALAIPGEGYLLAGSSRSDASSDKSEDNKSIYSGTDYWIVKIDADGRKVWNKTIGGEGSDDLISATLTPDGGYLLAGSSSSDASGDKSDNSKGKGNAESDYWIVKIDADGNKVWDKTIGGEGGDVLGSMVPTPDGGYLLGGYSDSDASGDKSEDNKSEYDFQNDYWIVKIDADGNKVWDKTIGGSGSDFFSSISPIPAGGYLLAGSTRSNASGDKSEDGKGTLDYWVVKIDAEGNKVWDKTIGGNKDDWFRNAIPTSDGNILFTGYSNSDASGDKSENSKGEYDYWIVKLKDTTTPVVTSLTLIDAKYEQEIRQLNDEDTVYLAEVKSGRLNIRANTFPEQIDRVEFKLDGPIAHTQVEKDFPYALFGDDPTGDYKGREWLPGRYTLTVTPYTKDEKGNAFTVSFEVTDAYEITGFTLIDATLNTEVGELSDDGLIELASLENHQLTIRADTKPMHVGKVTLSLEGPSTHSTTDQSYPYALFGDEPQPDGSPNYKGVRLKPGIYTLNATPYSQDEEGNTLTISFEVTNAFAITGFTLINATFDKILGELSDGDTIDVGVYPFYNLLTIRAETKPAKVGRVTFALEGPIDYSNTELLYPYTLFDDKPTRNGVPTRDGEPNYDGMQLPPGSYTLTTIPYASDSMGMPSILNFTVIDSFQPSEAASLHAKVYPVPTSDMINILYEEESKGTQIIIMDMNGNKLLNQPLSAQPVEQVDLSDFKKGIYYLKIVSPEDVQVFRVVKE